MQTRPRRPCRRASGRSARHYLCRTAGRYPRFRGLIDPGIDRSCIELFDAMTDPDPLPQFGANLRAAREARGLSQEGLAQRAGMDPAEIRRLEAARRDPGIRVLTRLA